MKNSRTIKANGNRHIPPTMAWGQVMSFIDDESFRDVLVHVLWDDPANLTGNVHLDVEIEATDLGNFPKPVASHPCVSSR